MKPAALLLAGLALLSASAVADRAAHAEEQRGKPDKGALPGGFENVVDDRLRVLERAAEPEVARQVRIERRVVIRISPSRGATSARLMAELPRRPMTTRYQEADHADCLPLDQLMSVQPMGDDRLLLITQDRRLLSAALDRSCSAQAFYAGFYVERSEDGRLCVNRDELQSRAGDTCRISSLSRLVAVRD
ncbi:MAG: hypothetical protein B7Y88_05180 [Sphingomonadales bacterium 32-64-17]|nr:MAG: hypothetical protein B7Y88_05180 [Sphingomonadales bacterium 32-64-17]